MRKTRQADLDFLEEGVSTAVSEDEKKHRRAILEDIYEQMKDPILEGLRLKLIDALKKGNFQKIFEIKKKVEKYASSKDFLIKRIKARERISKKESNILIKKLGRR